MAVALGNDTGCIGSTDPGKAGPTRQHRRHRPTGYGGQAQTDPWGSRLATGRTNGRWAANRVRPQLLSRTAKTASSESRRGRALVLRAACSERRGRSTTRTCEWMSRLRGMRQSRPEPRVCGWPDISPRLADRRNRVRLMPGAVHPADTEVQCAHPRRAFYKDPTVSLTFGFRTPRKSSTLLFLYQNS